VGDTTIGVKINGELRPLRTVLQNGDVVEVIRGAKPVVPPDWRSLTVTGPRPLGHPPHIRQTEREEFVRLGRAAVDQAFTRVNRVAGEVSLRPRWTASPRSRGRAVQQVGPGRITALQVWKPSSRA
jgi:GTP pyrophosphokinase/guanosine-3',5'-bis(diphosphate) 3'-pyrophosphohydrolase